MLNNQKNKPSQDLLRLRKVILNDNVRLSNGIEKILKNDVKKVLSGYFDLCEELLCIEITVTEDGFYEILINAKCKGIKQIKSI